jgi:hypothetical protein
VRLGLGGEWGREGELGFRPGNGAREWDWVLGLVIKGVANGVGIKDSGVGVLA